LSEVQSEKCHEILEIGSGTGIYTEQLIQKFPQAKILAIDISEQMNQLARLKFKNSNLEIITADAQSVNLSKKFDLITSNATLHWLANLDNFFSNYRNLLTPDGSLTFSIFGPKTFLELFTCLQYFKFKQVDFASQKFLDQKELLLIFKKYFTKIKIKEIIIKEECSSLLDLLKGIKYTGTRGYGSNRTWTPKFIKDLEKIYLDWFGSINVTYQIFLVKLN